jgi:hypothetical protein
LRSSDGTERVDEPSQLIVVILRKINVPPEIPAAE